MPTRFVGFIPWLLCLFVFPSCAAWSPQRDPSCLLSRGCPPAARIPPCPEEQASLPLEEVLARADSLNGSRVGVRGPLRKMGWVDCTIMGCVNSCCNHCFRLLVLATAPVEQEDPSSPRRRAYLVLSGDNVRCRGDESLVCCPLQADGQQVIAQGVLRVIDSYVGLEEVRVCALPPGGAP